MLLIGAGEEFSNVPQLSPGFRDCQIIAIFGFEGSHLGGIFEEIFAISPTNCITFGRVGPVFAAANRIFTVVLQGGCGNGLSIPLALHEVGQVNIVPWVAPWPIHWLSPTTISIGAVGAHGNIEPVTKRAPRFLNDVDLDSGFLLVQFADLLQVVGWGPLSPQDG